MSAKNHVRVTARKPGLGGEKIIEFSATGENVPGGLQGGLISIRILDSGTVKVDVYRLDPHVRVEVGS